MWQMMWYALDHELSLSFSVLFSVYVFGFYRVYFFICEFVYFIIIMTCFKFRFNLNQIVMKLKRCANVESALQIFLKHKCK